MESFSSLSPPKTKSQYQYFLTALKSPTSCPTVFTFTFHTYLHKPAGHLKHKALSLLSFFLFLNLKMKHHRDSMQEATPEDQIKRPKFFINDHIDILIEILKRLDGPSLGVAACVCRLWCTLTRNDDSLWENICFRHVSNPPPTSLRPVVVALGGYKRLYMVCVRPVLSRLGESERVGKRVWTRHEVQLSLSLFCIDSYERLSGGSGRFVGDASASSLMFLCKPVNV